MRIRFNMFTATMKAIGWRENRNGHKTRVYDKPRTPYQRVTDAGVLSPAKAAELEPCATPSARSQSRPTPVPLPRAWTVLV